MPNEEEWIERFTHAMDSLDWSRWGPFWSSGRLYAF